MKKVVLGALVGFAITFVFAFKAISSYELKKNTAEVEQYQGIYVFTDSKPAMEYEYLGTVKKTFGLSGSQYTDIRDGLIKKAKDDFPTANGIILIMKSGATDRADAIKIKEQ